MTQKQKALALAAQHGITVFKSGTNTFECDAPPFSLISGTDCHFIVCFGWDDMAQRISMGVEPCQDNACDCRDQLTNPEVQTPEAYAQWMGWELIQAGKWK